LDRSACVLQSAAAPGFSKGDWSVGALERTSATAVSMPETRLSARLSEYEERKMALILGEAPSSGAEAVAGELSQQQAHDDNLTNVAEGVCQRAQS
jgi:hypothetical protein